MPSRPPFRSCSGRANTPHIRRQALGYPVSVGVRCVRRHNGPHAASHNARSVRVARCGCASPPGDETDASQLTCPRGLARPFSIATLIRVAQEHGISLKREPNCDAPQVIVDAASNILIGDDVQDDDEVEAREGHVLCHIVDLPFAKPPFRVQRTKFATDRRRISMSPTSTARSIRKRRSRSIGSSGRSRRLPKRRSSSAPVRAGLPSR